MVLPLYLLILCCRAEFWPRDIHRCSAALEGAANILRPFIARDVEYRWRQAHRSSGVAMVHQNPPIPLHRHPIGCSAGRSDRWERRYGNVGAGDSDHSQCLQFAPPTCWRCQLGWAAFERSCSVLPEVASGVSQARNAYSFDRSCKKSDIVRVTIVSPVMELQDRYPPFQLRGKRFGASEDDDPVVNLLTAEQQSRLQRIATLVQIDRSNKLICAEGARCQFVWLVADGVVRISRCSETGRRQVLAFMMSGDMFGFPEEIGRAHV